jgi:triacylglycerol lipase
MLWGDLIWCGPGDHHDVLGHFRDDEAPARHVDWLDSGAAMTRRRFGEAMDSLASYLMA